MPGHRLREYAVLWKVSLREDGSKVLDDYGQPVLLDPVEIRAEWKAKNPPAQRLGRGVVNQIVSVDREIPLGSKLWQGKLTALPNVTSLTSLNLFEVIDYQEEKQRGWTYTRKVYCGQAGATIPDV